LLGPPGTNTQVVPLLLPTQLVHMAPPVLHASGAKPARQLLLLPSQQPPLHAVWPAPHAASHACVVVLHEVPLGQSAAALQPQLPIEQLLPSLARVQSMHPAPDIAQASPAMAAQTLLSPQQKPAPQTLPVPTLHKATQLPPEQAGVAPLHATHAMPSWPQAAAVPPSTQAAPSQQPPWQASPPAHEAEQLRVAGLHASPIGQSAGP
jgi:hypothetical protein